MRVRSGPGTSGSGGAVPDAGDEGSTTTPVRRILEALEEKGSAERAGVLRGGYAPTGFRVLGVSVPDLRRVLREVRPRLDARPAAGVLALARALAASAVMEGRVAGYELLGRRRDARALLDPEIVAELGAGNDTWALVDAFAVSVTGPAWREGVIGDADVMGWTGSPDRWWRRTALASTVPLNVASRGGSGDAPRTLAVASRLVDDRDPMVVKALSWALRCLAPREPAATAAFLDGHRERLSVLVLREVGNKLATGTKRGRRT